MAKETLPGGPDGGKKQGGFKGKVKEIFGTLIQSKEENMQKRKKLNDYRLNFFEEEYEKGVHYSGIEFDPQFPRHEISKGDRVDFEKVKDFIDCIDTGKLDRTVSGFWKIPNGVHVKVWDGTSEEYKKLFKKLWVKNASYLDLDFGNCSSGSLSGGPEVIKYLMKNLDIEGCKYCKFTIGYCNKKIEEKLVTWFTKMGKQGKIHNSIIEICGKKHHCLGNYDYEFKK